MRIGVISAYPDEDWDAWRIAEAAELRGEVRILAPEEFGAELSSAPGVPRVTVGGEDASTFDLFLTPRAIGEAGDPELQLELYRALGESGATLVNDVRALTTAIDKYRSSWLFARAGLPAPPVVIAQRLDEAVQAVEAMGQAVVKPIYGSLGIGIELVGAADSGKLAALLERHRALYLQQFVGGQPLDVRAFVVGDRVVAAIVRRPPPGEFRSNVGLGGETHAIDLEAVGGEAARVAVAAARALGLDYSGVDLLITDEGPLVIEANGTPSFRAVEEATGRDVAQAIVDHAIRKKEIDAERRHDRVGGRSQRGRAWRQTRRREYPRSTRTRLLRGDRSQGRPEGA